MLVKSYSYLIILNLFFLHRFYKRLYHNSSLGFGDSLAYIISHYILIKKDKDALVLDFGFITNTSIDFFFEKKKKIKLFFYIFKFLPHYNIASEFKKNKNFKLILSKKAKISSKFKNKDSIKNLFIAKLNRSKKINELKNSKLFNKKYICISIKSYKIRDYFFGSGPRATYDLDTINKVIEYLIIKGFDILILGLNSDYAVIEQKKKFRENKNVKFLIDQFPDYNFDCQVYFALNSSGFLGSAAGISQMYYLLQKKSIFINCVSKNHLLNPEDPDQEKKYNKYLFKKVKIKNTYEIVKLDFLQKASSEKSKINFEIVENSFDEIKSLIDEYMNRNYW